MKVTPGNVPYVFSAGSTKVGNANKTNSNTSSILLIELLPSKLLVMCPVYPFR